MRASMRTSPHRVYACVLAVVFAAAVPHGVDAQSASLAALRADYIDSATRAHLERARTAAYIPGHSLMRLYETVCAPALAKEGPREPGLQVAPSFAERQKRVPPQSQWYSAPAKVFDNLYWLGSVGNAYSEPELAGDSTWAVTTSAGIILIDTANEYSAPTLITEGLQKVGLNARDIKYVVLTHPHGDRYFGSTYVQKTYDAKVLMSERDWQTLDKSNEPAELKPRKDMVVTDGMKLTLGDTTLTLYVTPGHTPGTVSVLVPLKDGRDRHLGVVWGGINPSFERYGVRYYSTLQETFQTWSASAARMRRLAREANADVYLTIHPFYDNALDKIYAVDYRDPGEPHPLVSRQNLDNFLTIIEECTRAQLARIEAKAAAPARTSDARN
jgi:metallo-beta-lactamase class B